MLLNQDFFFENNTKSQTILLVSTVLKLFGYLTTRDQRTQFWSYKSSITYLIFPSRSNWGGYLVHVGIELESNGLKFCHIEIEFVGLDLVLLPFASRTGDELSCSFKPKNPWTKPNTKPKTNTWSDWVFSSSKIFSRTPTCFSPPLEQQRHHRSGGEKPHSY